MPQISFSEALRYFFAPFAALSYLYISDKELAVSLVASIGPVGTITFLVAGTILYFTYRGILHPFILWFFDLLRHDTYRRFINREIEISDGAWMIWHSRKAESVFKSMGVYDGNKKLEDIKVSYGGISLLYQAGLLAIPFLACEIYSGNSVKACLFGSFMAIFLLAGILQDFQAEDIELSLVMKNRSLLKDAAELNLLTERQKK